MKYINVILLLSFVGFIVYYEIRSNARFDWSDKYLQTNMHIKETVKTKYILRWEKFWNSDVCLNFNFSICPKVKACKCTDNKTLMPIQNFDAIILRWPTEPGNRTRKQKYIFYTTESPVTAPYMYEGVLNYYNLTINYRKEVDIPYPYGTFSKKIKDKEGVTVDQLKNKTKLVAWLVSQSVTAGSKYRMKFVKELEKFIKVDIYGRLGNTNVTCPGKMSLQCYNFLDLQYKFYLAFENSLCYEYITEKTYNILKYTNMVPVVLGFADYETLTPPMSVINADNFDTIQQLAEYLMYLDRNDDELLKYFEWKKFYDIEVKNDTKMCCKLCEKVHEERTFWHKDIKDWSRNRNGSQTCYWNNTILRINTTRSIPYKTGTGKP